MLKVVTYKQAFVIILSCITFQISCDQQRDLHDDTFSGKNEYAWHILLSSVFFKGVFTSFDTVIKRKV